MFGRDNPKPITADEFKSLCIKARRERTGLDEASLLQSLCEAMIEDLKDPDLTCPEVTGGTTALMDAILCDYLVYRYERESSFDPFPIIQSCLLKEPRG